MEMKFTSPNGKWQIFAGRGTAARYRIRIESAVRDGVKDVEFNSMEEFILADPSRLEKGKNREIPQLVSSAAVLIATQIMIEWK